MIRTAGRFSSCGHLDAQLHLPGAALYRFLQGENRDKARRRRAGEATWIGSVLLEAGAAGANEIAQRADVGAVRANAPGIDRQAEHFSALDAQAGIVKLSKAIAFGGHQTVAAR